MVGTEIRPLQRGLERIARLPKLGLTTCAGTTCGAGEHPHGRVR
jgi:hypothetical protein